MVPGILGPIYNDKTAELIARFDEISILNIEDVSIVKTDFYGAPVPVYNVLIIHRFEEDGGKIVSYFYFATGIFLNHVYNKVNDDCRAKIFSILFGE